MQTNKSHSSLELTIDGIVGLPVNGQDCSVGGDLTSNLVVAQPFAQPDLAVIFQSLPEPGADAEHQKRGERGEKSDGAQRHRPLDGRRQRRHWEPTMSSTVKFKLVYILRISVDALIVTTSFSRGTVNGELSISREF